VTQQKAEAEMNPNEPLHPRPNDKCLS